MVSSTLIGGRQTAVPESPAGGLTARICLSTARDVTKRAYQCGLYEAEDVLHGMGEVDVIRLQSRKAGFRFQFDWHKRLTYRDFSGTLALRNPGLRRVRLTQEYDLFVAVCQGHSDLLYINAIEGWKDLCRTSVCWLDEMWAIDVPLIEHWLPALARFDYVFVGYQGTVGPLSQALGKPCGWLPGGTDTIRFSPYPQPPARVIDVYSIGRRRENIHRALLQAAAAGEMFYVYDTFPEIADMEPYQPGEHREFFANMAKRSRYFTAAPGKVNRAHETVGQVEVGYRYFEGASAGAVLIGEIPDCASFQELFPWPDAVVPIAPDGSDTIDVLTALNRDADRRFAMSRRNGTEALLRHDWVYRWKEVFRRAGVAPPAGMTARELRLQELASLAGSGSL